MKFRVELTCVAGDHKEVYEMACLDHGETISTAIAESTVNQVISKRMVQHQQM